MHCCINGKPFAKLRDNIHKSTKIPTPLHRTSTYTLKMRLDKPIPQMIPMYGKKVTLNIKAASMVSQVSRIWAGQVCMRG